MLSRGFYDALALWPAVVWPLVFSSCLYALIQMSWTRQDGSGLAPLDARRLPDVFVVYIFFPVAVLFEIAVHGYLLWIIGYVYAAIAIPIYIFGWILLPWILDSFRPAQFLLPLVYLLFAAAFVVLLGLADIGLLRAFNSEFYSLLTGLPAKL